MLVDPLVVNELRSLFKTGATPSALIRRIADRHAGEPKLDVLVRAYFRDAFHVPMIRIGPEQVRQIAAGGSLPFLNVTVVHRMIQTRREWDALDGADSPSEGCWLDSVAATDEVTLIAATDPQTLPELAGSWDRMDEEAKQFIKRIIGNSHSLHEKVNVIAALAEQLQQQRAMADIRRAQGA
jgi:hypothetical protein